MRNLTCTTQAALQSAGTECSCLHLDGTEQKVVTGASDQLRSSSSTSLPCRHKHGPSQTSLHRQHPRHRDNPSSAALAICPPTSYCLHLASAIPVLRLLHLLPSQFVFEQLIPKRYFQVSRLRAPSISPCHRRYASEA